jgi:hypothetical protein
MQSIWDWLCHPLLLSPTLVSMMDLVNQLISIPVSQKTAKQTFPASNGEIYMEACLMHRRFIVFSSALLISAALISPAAAQQRENRGEQAAEKKMDVEAAANASREPNMAAALRSLRQAEEALERATTQHGGYRAAALKNIAQAEANVVKGIQYFNSHSPQKKK